MINLVCPECRRENEPERIYCHDCGARLDRSALAKAPIKEEDSAATHKRVKAMFEARGLKARTRFFQISKLILGAMAAAALIQMIRPADMPEVPKTDVLPRQISMDLENSRATPLRYTTSEVNAYLAYALKTKQAALSKLLKFERVAVDLQEGYADVTIERSFMEYSVFTSESLAMSLQNGVLTAKSRGGRIGRFPIHPFLMAYAAPFLLGDLATVLERERKSITKLASVELHPDSVTFTPKQQ